jgi:hypothetical protein
VPEGRQKNVLRQILSVGAARTKRCNRGAHGGLVPADQESKRIPVPGTDPAD